jgi:hypothetical protein
LLSGFVKGVEGVKKFSLSSLLSRDELNVINEKNIHLPKLVPELIHFLISNGVDKLVREFLRREITDFSDFRKDTIMENVVSNSVEQVSLPQSHPSIDKEGIIVFRWKIGDGKTGRIGKLVTCPDDKIIEGILGVEHRNGLMRPLPFPFFRTPRTDFLFARSYISDTKLEETRFLGQMGDSLLDLKSIMLVDPFLEKTIWNFEFHTVSLHRNKGNRFYPDVEILLTHPFFQGVGHFSPKVFHGLNHDRLG